MIGNDGREAPAVSIIIPVYNGAAYISDALDSIFAQTFKDFEVIVINDGSLDTENLECVLRPYMERLVYLKQENQGPSAARNLGINHARGEYIAFLDSDDWWLPGYLAHQIKVLEESPSVAMTCSDTQLFGASPWAGQTFWSIHPPKVPVTFESLLIEDSAIVTSCTVARKRVITQAGLFDTKFGGGEDFDLWLRVAHIGGEIVFLREVLGRRRVHSNALTAANDKIQASLVGVLRKLDRTLPLTPRMRSLLRQQITINQAYVDLEAGKRYLCSGDSEKARESLTKANAFFRTQKLRVALVLLRIAPRFAALTARIWQVCLSHFADYQRRVA